VARAQANLAAAGYLNVIVVCGDGGFGAPDYAPYDRLIVTAGAWDLAPEWLAELGPGGRIVLPLSVRGIQMCLALEREAGHWRSRSACRCGFIRLAGVFATPEPFVPVGPQPGMQVQTDDGRPLDAAALYDALTGPVTDVPSGVPLSGLGELAEADLWVTVTEPGLVRLTITGRGPLRAGVLRGAVLPLLPFGALAGSGDLREPQWAGDFGVAALIPAPSAVPPSERRYPESGIVVRGFGPAGADLAERLASRVSGWHDQGRPRASGLSVIAYPLGTPVAARPGQTVLDRRHTRLVLSWPPPEPPPPPPPPSVPPGSPLAPPTPPLLPPESPLEPP
jgi:protein-L-isoaspartate(D-aspartate) O-methyltransferase